MENIGHKELAVPPFGVSENPYGPAAVARYERGCCSHVILEVPLGEARIGYAVGIAVLNAGEPTNGIHTAGPDQIPWSGMTVTYTKGKPLDYGGNVWDVVTTISQGILEMLEEVVNSTKIIQENEILDPSYADLQKTCWRGLFYSTSRYKWSECTSLACF